MANTFSAKCDLCGTVQVSEKAHELRMTRYVMNTETKHACEECRPVLSAVFMAGIGGVKEPLAEIGRLNQKIEFLNSTLRRSESQMKNLENNSTWGKQDLETMRSRMLDISVKYNGLLGMGKDIFEQFENLKLSLEDAKQNWGGGFWATLAAFDRTKKTFATRADEIIASMQTIKELWSKDKTQPGGAPGLPAPKGS